MHVLDGLAAFEAAQQINGGGRWKVSLIPPARMPDMVLLRGTLRDGTTREYHIGIDIEIRDAQKVLDTGYLAREYLEGLLARAVALLDAVSTPDADFVKWEYSLGRMVHEHGWEPVGTWEPTMEELRIAGETNRWFREQQHLCAGEHE